MMQKNTKPRLLNLNDLEAAVKIMSEAFFMDPLWVYLLPNEDRRKKVLKSFFEILLLAGISNNQVYGVSNPIEGVVIWEKPDSTFNFPWKVLIPGIVFFIMNIVVLIRAWSVFRKFSIMQENNTPGKHYYLISIGINPESQGKGLASILIRPFLDESIRNGYGVYTETVTPENVPIYEHYGLKVVDKFSFEEKKLDLWAFYLMNEI
jgi:ribosomal protein S18 acetylase RimI-like enzyme